MLLSRFLVSAVTMVSLFAPALWLTQQLCPVRAGQGRRRSTAPGFVC